MRKILILAAAAAVSVPPVALAAEKKPGLIETVGGAVGGVLGSTAGAAGGPLGSAAAGLAGQRAGRGLAGFVKKAVGGKDKVREEDAAETAAIAATSPVPEPPPLRLAEAPAPLPVPPVDAPAAGGVLSADALGADASAVVGAPTTETAEASLDLTATPD